MKIMIVGGGNVGYYLLKTLADEKHHVMMVENNEKHCEDMAAELESSRVEITCGDGSDVDVLRDAGINRIDTFIAVTGKDEDNFVACQLAKDFFGVKLTISRVNNPKNIRVFEKIGVDSVISSTTRITNIINQEIDWNDVNRLLGAKSLGVRIREADIEVGSPFVNKKLHELGLPDGVIIVSIIRDQEAVVPGGDTVLRVGDTAIIMGKDENITEVMGLLR